MTLDTSSHLSYSLFCQNCLFNYKTEYFVLTHRRSGKSLGGDVGVLDDSVHLGLGGEILGGRGQGRGHPVLESVESYLTVDYP